MQRLEDLRSRMMVVDNKLFILRCGAISARCVPLTL